MEHLTFNERHSAYYRDPSLRHLRSAYWEGQRAGVFKTNPYQKDDLRHLAWQDGRQSQLDWQDADIQEP